MAGNYSLSPLVGFELRGKTVGIIGTGAIGAEACRIFKVRLAVCGPSGLSAAAVLAAAAAAVVGAANSQQPLSYVAMMLTSACMCAVLHATCCLYMLCRASG